MALDGLSEEDFRRSIENRLREDRATVAVERLRRLLAPFAAPGGVLPERFLTVTAEDLELTGWSTLGTAVAAHDRPGHPITAVSITFAWPGDDAPGPDAAGNLRPHLETGFFSDDAFPFSQSGREDLLEGYSYHGCTWAADCEAVDTTLALDGIDDLNGALARLEAELLASDEPDEQGILAGSLGACLLSTLLFQAVGARIARDGLPRPLCVTAGSNGVYPYFDAPVAGIAEADRPAPEAEPEPDVADLSAPAPRYSSLLMTGIPRARKRAVLVLEEDAGALADRLARLRDIAHGDAAGEQEAASAGGVPATGDPHDQPIEAAAASPLMVRKPHEPGSDKGWDFREMLTPLEHAAHDRDEPEDPAEDSPEDSDWGAYASLDQAASPPVNHPEPAPEAAPQLGVRERLEALMVAYAPPAPEPEPIPESEPEPVIAAAARTQRPVHERSVQTWSGRPAWLDEELDDAAADIVPSDDPGEPDLPAARGILARVGDWIARHVRVRPL